MTSENPTEESLARALADLSHQLLKGTEWPLEEQLEPLEKHPDIDLADAIEEKDFEEFVALPRSKLSLQLSQDMIRSLAERLVEPGESIEDPPLQEKGIDLSLSDQRLQEVRSALGKSRELGEKAQERIDALLDRQPSVHRA